MNTIIPIKRALVSVHDKSELKDFVTFLHSKNVLVLSTGGTARFLQEEGLSVTDASLMSQFPEILDGRVKTLNPRIYAGILCDRAKSSHITTMNELDIPTIDLVVGNLYPFSAISSQLDVCLSELIENIDIGGPAMLRAAAKNYHYVTVLHHPIQYQEFIAHYNKHMGTTLAFREQCAAALFAFTCEYDQKITQVFKKRFTGHYDTTCINLKREKNLRYGENPHQRAQVLSNSLNDGDICLPSLSLLSGKELSYNNLLDAHAAIWALRCLADHQPHNLPAAVIIKHGIPCGAAIAQNVNTAVTKAIASDEKSAFGGILAFSSSCDETCIDILDNHFFEVIIAPSFAKNAITRLTKKKNLRLLPIDNLMTGALDRTNYRSIFGGMLQQDQETTKIYDDMWSITTQAQPSKIDLMAMDFAFRMVKATPSNAITIAHPEQLLGVGAGQPNRIQSTEIAIFAAKTRGFDLRNAAMASDGFFPFDDCVEFAYRNGIRLIIQPGGSLHDQKIIDCANERGISMVFTHRRHFRH
jgi:phosphoribosylaminoimidazolecarboxamide formyltransferase/IMP cyclohydrolase